MNSSGRAGAIAGILSKFLPVVDRLSCLSELHGGDEFGKQYNALLGDMQGAFKTLGATEYAPSPGDSIDASRVAVKESMNSPDHPSNTVLKTLVEGIELEGNIIRKAECVASLGPEKVDETNESDSEGELALLSDEKAK